jgi:hypothetical protein
MLTETWLRTHTWPNLVSRYRVGTVEPAVLLLLCGWTRLAECGGFAESRDRLGRPHTTSGYDNTTCARGTRQRRHEARTVRFPSEHGCKLIVIPVRASGVNVGVAWL